MCVNWYLLIQCVSVCVGDEDLELGGEEALDSQNLSKRDIHTLNEQRR